MAIALVVSIMIAQREIVKAIKESKKEK